jgi:hypothetical protein
VTSAGASGITAATYSLTVQATNADGNGTGTVSVVVSAASGSGYDIPLSWDDPMFTNMTNNLIPNAPSGPGHVAKYGESHFAPNQTISHTSVVIPDGYCPFVFNQTGNATLSYARIDTTVSADAAVLTQTKAASWSIDHVYIDNNSPSNPTGTHVDGIQFQDLINETSSAATVNINNTMIITGGNDVTGGIFVADGWFGTINLTHVILQPWTQPGLIVNSDTGGNVHISLNNVFFDTSHGGSRGILKNWGGHQVIIDAWNNVRDCTVVNGVLTLGNLIPKPTPTTNGTNF